MSEKQGYEPNEAEMRKAERMVSPQDEMANKVRERLQRLNEVGVDGFKESYGRLSGVVLDRFKTDNAIEKLDSWFDGGGNKSIPEIQQAIKDGKFEGVDAPVRIKNGTTEISDGEKKWVLKGLNSFDRAELMRYLDEGRAPIMPALFVDKKILELDKAANGHFGDRVEDPEKRESARQEMQALVAQLKSDFEIVRDYEVIMGLSDEYKELKSALTGNNLDPENPEIFTK